MGQNHLHDKHMKSALRAIDVDESHAIELFNLIDDTKQGEIEIEEFVNGCLQVAGLAKAIDLASLTHEVRQTNKKWIDQAEFVNQSLMWTTKTLHDLKKAIYEDVGRSGGNLLRLPTKSRRASLDLRRGSLD